MQQYQPPWLRCTIPGPNPDLCSCEDPLHLRLYSPSRYTDYVSPPFVLTQGGVPLPYSGASATLMVRHRPSDIAPLVTITTTPSASGSIVFFPMSPMVIPGAVQFTILKAANQLLALPEVVFDLVVVWSTGLTSVLLGGRLCQRQGVTR